MNHGISELGSDWFDWRLAARGDAGLSTLWLVMTIWFAYFDESYNSSWTIQQPVGTDIFTVAGFLASEHDWKAFRVKWDEVKRSDYQLSKPFHATDSETANGAFRGWPQDRRDEIRTDLAWLCASFVHMGVSVSVSCADYNRLVVPHLLEPEDSMPIDPYVFCAQGCLEQIAKAALPQGAQVSCMFENPTKRKGVTTRRYEGLLDHFPDWGFQNGFLRPVTFGAKADVPELEAADFLAYESFKEAQLFEPNERAQQLGLQPQDDHVARRPYLRPLITANRLQGGLHSGPTLVKLVQTMLELRKNQAAAQAKGGTP